MGSLFKMLLLLLETITDDPVVEEFDDVDEEDDAVCDVLDVDVEVDPVFVLTTLMVDIITQVAAGDRTYPVVHFTHLKSVVNY